MMAVSRQTLSNWRRDGAGPAWVRLGPRTVRYPRAAVEQWMRDGWRR